MKKSRLRALGKVFKPEIESAFSKVRGLRKAIEHAIPSHCYSFRPAGMQDFFSGAVEG